MPKKVMVTIADTVGDLRDALVPFMDECLLTEPIEVTYLPGGDEATISLTTLTESKRFVHGPDRTEEKHRAHDAWLTRSKKRQS